MDQFEKRTFFVPIEVVIVIAINLVSASLATTRSWCGDFLEANAHLATKLPESLVLLERSWWTLRWDGMQYGSAKKGPVIAAVGALALARKRISDLLSRVRNLWWANSRD
jgi:hypothetical protein